jgi:hypothetical protein
VNLSGSSKRATQVRAWGMCVLALEAHRRLGGSVSPADPRYQLAPDDLLSSVRILASATDPNPAVTALICTLDELTQLPASFSVPTPAGLLSTAELPPTLSRDLSHSSLVLEVQVDLSEWAHESYRQQVATGLKALPQDQVHTISPCFGDLLMIHFGQVARLMQKLALSEDLHGEEFRVIRDLYPLLYSEKASSSLKDFYVQLTESLLSTMSQVDEAEWNRCTAALTRLVNGIVSAEGMFIMKQNSSHVKR